YGIRPVDIRIHHRRQADRLALLLELVKDARMIASKCAHANHRNVDEGISGQIGSQSCVRFLPKLCLCGGAGPCGGGSLWRRVSDPPARVEDPGPHLPATLMKEFPVRLDPNPSSDFLPKLCPCGGAGPCGAAGPCGGGSLTRLPGSKTRAHTRLQR